MIILLVAIAGVAVVAVDKAGRDTVTVPSVLEMRSNLPLGPHPTRNDLPIVKPTSLCYEIYESHFAKYKRERWMYKPGNVMPWLLQNLLGRASLIATEVYAL